jgi:hypothetical protein
MDNCAGTNKSQYMFGALALILLVGALDALTVEFMVSGHTKMHLDWVFSKSGTSFRGHDVFNDGMLDAIFCKYFATHSYGAAFLRNFKDGTTQLFDAIDEITKCRSFIFKADEGRFGDDLVCVSDANGGSQHTYTAASVEAATTKLAERSLNVLLPIASEALHYRGVGDGTGLNGPRADENIFPGFRHVRLFKREVEGDGPWIEQPKYQKTTDVSAIKAAILTIIPFNDLPEDHPTVVNLSAAYGQKEKQLKDQFGLWVPRKHVPDCYDLLPQGCSGLCNKAAYLSQLSKDDQLRAQRKDEEEAQAQAQAQALANTAQVARESGAPPPPTTTKTGKQRWAFHPHDRILIDDHLGDPPFAIPEKAMKKRSAEIGKVMGMDPRQVKTAHTRLVKAKTIKYKD